MALTAGGTPQPLIAAQRYGQGRSMVFAGEASWRWRMLRPATDTSYETIWRQLARWVTAGAQGPVTIGAMSPAVPGITDRISVVVRDEDFRPVANAEVAIEMTAPNGEKRQMPAALSSPQDGRYAVAARFDQPGVYKIDAIATRGGTRIGRASRPVLVGGVDLEMTQPRLNEAVLRRLAAESDGRYVARRPGGAAAVAAARIARRSRHAGDCATSGTMDGACWRSSDCWRRSGWRDDGWDWRDGQILTKVTKSTKVTMHFDQRSSCRSLFVVAFVGGAADAVAENRWAVIISGASGGEKYAEQMTTWRNDLRAALVDRYQFKPEFVKMFVDETATTGDKGSAENVTQVLRRDEEDVGQGRLRVHRPDRPRHLRRQRREVQPGRP